MADEKKPTDSSKGSGRKRGAAEVLEGEETQTRTRVPEGPRKPARTLDLEAEEVKAEAETPEAEKPEGDKAEAEKAASTTAAKQTAGARKTAASTRTSARKDKKPAAASARKAQETGKDAGQKTGGREKPEPVPARTSARELRGFVTHLAAGLVGGLAGVVAAGLALDAIPAGGPRGPGESAPQAVSEISGRVDTLMRSTQALEQRLAALEGSSQQTQTALSSLKESLAAQQTSLTSLKEALAALEQTLAGRAAAEQAAAERLAQLERTIKALGQAAETGGDVSQTAAIESRIGETETRLAGRIASLEERLESLPPPPVSASDIDTLRAALESLRGDLDTLRENIAARAPAQADAARAEVEAVKQRLEALDEKVTSLAARSQSADDGAGARAIAFSLLADALTSGAPYAQELAALRKHLPADVDLSALERHAASGVATRQELRQDFERIAARLRGLSGKPGASHPEAGGGLVEQFLDNARSIIKIRRIGEPERAAETRPEGRVRPYVEAGDLKGALAAINQLPEEARNALRPWLSRVQARLEAEAALRTLATQLAGRPGQ
ncbi:MAG: hypothetical protein Kow0032_09060 [Methyloligellaceae bacterium]